MMMTFGSAVTSISGVIGSLFWGWAAVRLGKDRAFRYSLVAIFQEGLETQPDVFVTRIRWLYVLIPMATIGVSFLLMLFYPITENRAREIRRILDERHATETHGGIAREEH